VVPRHSTPQETIGREGHRSAHSSKQQNVSTNKKVKYFWVRVPPRPSRDLLYRGR